MVSPDTLLVPLSEHPVRPRAPGLHPAISLQRRQDTRSLGHATAPYATSLSILGKDFAAAGRWKPGRDRTRSCRRASGRRSRVPLEVRGPRVLRRSQRVVVQQPRHARLPAVLRWLDGLYFSGISDADQADLSRRAGRRAEGGRVKPPPDKCLLGQAVRPMATADGRTSIAL